MKINHSYNARFNSIHLGDCFKLVDDVDVYIKALVRVGNELCYEVSKLNAVNLVTGVAVYISEDTEIVAFLDATLNLNE